MDKPQHLPFEIEEWITNAVLDGKLLAATAEELRSVLIHGSVLPVAEDGDIFIHSDHDFVRRHLGKFAIQHGDILVRKIFDNEEEAKPWAEWNYRNKANWNVCELRLGLAGEQKC
jgi:hypothetical protein